MSVGFSERKRSVNGTYVLKDFIKMALKFKIGTNFNWFEIFGWKINQILEKLKYILEYVQYHLFFINP